APRGLDLDRSGRRVLVADRREIHRAAAARERLLPRLRRQVPARLPAGRLQIRDFDSVQTTLVDRPVAGDVNRRVAGGRLDVLLVLRDGIAVTVRSDL